MAQSANTNLSIILFQLKPMLKKLNFVILASYSALQELLTVMTVICVWRDLIIIALGLEIASEKGIINIFSYFPFLLLFSSSF